MLDTQTKQRINNARQVLVGVVPNPQAQIEQITTALIYKFMDDMDRENEEIGRQATFLIGELADCAWGKLMSKALSGDARWQLYTGALEKFANAKQIPSFFRTIFKDAYLPYRDARVLNLFLTEINHFSYEHSEKLGDAFEYLLSISGAQADAGQFRTPRHIIDFITEIIAPQKHERILDPACGTAGFLISAYKHIIKHNSSSFNPNKTNLPFTQQGENASDFAIQNNGFDGDKLTPGERDTLANNIHGYDVAPEMVRLSLVNLYLHGFISPQISNYDTLTYDTNWGDDYDVILANPPFMTPKGGIRPHNRFSVRANRAEVLFVDYIAEHLTIKGRAGIIVPEGIIFQAANAYKSLRKNLIENWGLYCVVSLPAGVFQPYSGVKTSILLLDKAQTKNPNILFINIQNDGFGLGAQRRKIDKNDLPQAYDAIKYYQQNGTIKDSDKDIALIAPKSKISEDGDYNLSANRYKEEVDYSHAKWDMVALGSLETIKIIDGDRGKNYPKKNDFSRDGFCLFLNTSNVRKGYFNFQKLDYISKEKDELLNKGKLKKYDVILTTRGTLGNTACYDGKVKYSNIRINSGMVILRSDKNKLLPNFLLKILNSEPFKKQINNFLSGSAQPQLPIKALIKLKIPLPPLKIQQQIVAEIEAYQKVIDGAKQVIKHYKPTLKINPDWQMVALGDETLFQIESGGTPSTKKPEYWGGDINWTSFVDLPVSDFITVIKETKKKITIKGVKNSSAKLLSKDSILISSRATIGRIAIAKCELCTNQGFKNIIIKNFDITDSYFVALMITNLVDRLEQLSEGSTYKEFSKSDLSSLSIPLPPLKDQQQVVAEIEAEQAAINECKKLIVSQEQKIKAKMDEVWR